MQKVTNEEVVLPKCEVDEEKLIEESLDNIDALLEQLAKKVPKEDWEKSILSGKVINRGRDIQGSPIARFGTQEEDVSPSKPPKVFWYIPPENIFEEKKSQEESIQERLKTPNFFSPISNESPEKP